MDLLKYYQSAHLRGLSPTLLEFKHPRKNTPLSICAIEPVTTLEVRMGRLYKDGVEVGPALDIFDYLGAANFPSPASSRGLTTGSILGGSSPGTAVKPRGDKDKGFFPAYLGFFSYEFAASFGLPTHQGPRRFRDAFFRLYEKGLVIDDGEIIHHDKVPFYDVGPGPKIDFQSITPALSKESFIEAVSSVKNSIKQGQVYQVNLSLPFYFDNAQMPPLDLYQAMRKLNPSPFMGLIEHDDWAIISGSPERLFSLANSQLSARPIAGTKRRGSDQLIDDETMTELLNCPKENAEHVMLVDLMRNDINQVAEAGSVIIDEDRSVEFYSHVMHLVSQVSGSCTQPLQEVVQALFPGGTITGAPKKSVMAAIAELELMPRGPYTGSLGYISSGFGTDLNILIRSVLKAQGRMWINSGAGIVIDSDPESEWSEVQRKAGFIRDILQHQVQPKDPRETRVGPAKLSSSNLIRGSLQMANSLVLQVKPEDDHVFNRVLFVENQDSFSFNIVAALKSLGAEVQIIPLLAINTQTSHGPAACPQGPARWRYDWMPRTSRGTTSGIGITGTGEAFELKHFSHVVIGPGPGNPEEMPELMQLISAVIEARIPLLGICLGHQAIAHYFGAPIVKRAPIHGRSLPITHRQERLFQRLSSPANFTRYHSLAVSHVPADFFVDAVSQDDCIMAISHQSWPIFGVQFHPESYLSKDGHVILSNFLRTTTWPL